MYFTIYQVISSNSYWDDTRNALMECLVNEVWIPKLRCPSGRRHGVYVYDINKDFVLSSLKHDELWCENSIIKMAFAVELLAYL